MGLFDFLRKRAPNQPTSAESIALDQAMKQLLPGGKPQLALGAAKLRELSAGALATDEANSLYIAMLYLHVFAEDRSRERLLWSLRQKTNDSLSHAQMERMLSFLKAELSKYKIAGTPPSRDTAPTSTQEVQTHGPSRRVDPTEGEIDVAVNVSDLGQVLFLERQGRLRKIDKALFSSLLLVASSSGWSGSSALLRGNSLVIGDGASLTDEEARQLGVALRLAAAKHSPARGTDAISQEIQQFMDYCADGAFSINATSLPEIDPRVGAKKLTDQALGTQSVLFRLFTQKFGVHAEQIRRIELTYFATFLLNYFCLAHPRFDEIKNALEPFRHQTFELSLRSAGEALNSQQAAFEYSKRYAEYKALLDAMLQRDKSGTGRPDVTLLLHLYETVTRQSAQKKMIEVLVGGSFMWDLVSDSINFVHMVFPVKPLEDPRASK